MHRLPVVVALILALASPALAAPAVVIRMGSSPGGATLVVKNAISRVTGPTYDLRVNVPQGVARELAKAAQDGKVLVSTGTGLRGSLVRIIAGTGNDTIVVDRMRQAGKNGQPGVDGVIRVQYGLGASAKAVYYGRTSGRGAKHLGGGKFRATAGVTRTGMATLINPQTLEPDAKGTLDGSTQKWYVKAVGTSNRTTDPRAALKAFAPYGALSRGVTASSAILQIASGL